jgi:hypothetical protein
MSDAYSCSLAWSAFWNEVRFRGFPRAAQVTTKMARTAVLQRWWYPPPPPHH